MYLFVYGTLRKGEVNHKVLAESACIHEQAVVKGNLFDTGYGYPGLIEDTFDNVYGELYWISHSILREVDILEGFIEGRSDNLYERVIRQVITDTETFEAVVYIYNNTASLSKKVDFQDWKVYQWLNNRKALPYFAYGSCMDTERIEAAGLEEAFEQWTQGLASGYTVDYTKYRPDGARADILEQGEDTAEGILYTTSPEAVDYLFKREGVLKGAYRPAFIEVYSQPETVLALTFIVIDKNDPKAPPWHYAKEILRGAGRGLSKQYQRKLYQRLKELNTELYPEELR